jgi:hypothetical protein
MPMHPITFTKQHPAGVVVSFAMGMVFGPWLLNAIQGKTGVGLSLPSYGGGGS